MGCVASTPTGHKSKTSKVCPQTYGGRTCFQTSGIVGFARSPFWPYLCLVVATGWRGRHEWLTSYSSLQGTPSIQTLRYITLCCRTGPAVQFRLVHIHRLCFNFPHLFVLQASPYDTRNLADPKDVMPYLPESCGSICQVLSPWPGCGKPANEAERLAATEKLQLIGKEPHPALQRYVDLISTCYQVRHQDLPSTSAEIQRELLT